MDQDHKRWVYRTSLGLQQLTVSFCKRMSVMSRHTLLLEEKQTEEVNPPRANEPWFISSLLAALAIHLPVISHHHELEQSCRSTLALSWPVVSQAASRGSTVRLWISSPSPWAQVQNQKAILWYQNTRIYHGFYLMLHGTHILYSPLLPEIHISRPAGLNMPTTG